MSEAIVTKNNGEVAQFSDSGTIIRQRPGLGTAIGVNYTKIIQPDHFKFVFPVGATKSQVNERLENPLSTDGVPIGSPYPTNTITMGPKLVDPSQIGRINAVGALRYAIDSARTAGLKNEEILSEIVKYMSEASS